MPQLKMLTLLYLMCFLVRLIRAFDFRLKKASLWLRSRYWTQVLRNAGAQVGCRLEVRKGAQIAIGKFRKLEIGHSVILGDFASLYIGPGAEVIIGDGVFIGKGTVMAANGSLKIGPGTQIAHQVTLIDSDHEFKDPAKPLLAQGSKIGKVEIGSEVWIGAGAVILKNCHIGNHGVIGAGAVVTKDVPENAVAVGNPARLLSKAKGLTL